MSWFRTIDRPSLSGAITSADAAYEASGAAALFDDSTLWHDPAEVIPTRADLRYPTGGRPLVKVWSSGGDLEISQGDNVVRIRAGATVHEIPVGPGARSVADLVAALTAVDGVEAAAVETVDAYDLPWPSSLSDPADESDPRVPAGDPGRTAFTRLPGNENDAYVLRHAPAAELATTFGLTGPSGGSRFDGVRLVPQTTLGDVEDTGLGAAADLALLLSLGAASRLRSVTAATPDPAQLPGAPAVPGTIDPLTRVFRDWNLDDRRVNEWRMLVTGGATAEDFAPPDDLLEGERVANALGWVPLWRTWLRMASDPTQDAAAPTAASYVPVVRTADGEELRATNAQLSAGICYLLDLPS
jgi:hypothetical protein